MINAKPISQNADRYRISNDGWQVTASPDIKPLEFQFGKPTSDLKPVINADGVIISAAGFLLCSKNTLKIIEGMGNPHYDVSVNGTIMVRDKQVKLGSTIPIIKLDFSRLPTIAATRKDFNTKAGVETSTYIYQSEEIMGVPKGIIEQLNYTMVEGEKRPGDTFSYWKWIKDNNPNYNLKQLNIDTAQEDGKLDKTKLKTFVTTVGERLTALRKDFNSIKRTFFYGEKPASMDAYLLNLKDYSVNPEDDITEHQFVEKTTTVVKTTTPATQQTAIKAATPPPPAVSNEPQIKLWYINASRTNKWVPVFKEDPALVKYPKDAGRIYGTNYFWGILDKANWRNNEKIFKVYADDKKTFKGWGIADSKDNILEVRDGIKR